MIGQVFNRLTVIKALPNRISNNRSFKRVRCKCTCGTEKDYDFDSIRSGNAKSCGCLRKEKLKETATTHGLASHPLYIKHKGMLSRCYNSNGKDYANYGGRGIKVCKEWRGSEGFQNFYTWAMANGYHPKLELNRIKNHKHYSPDNCNFITHTQNSMNKRTNVYVKIDGKKLTITEACDKLGKVSAKTAFARIYAGYSAYDAVTKEKRGARVR